MPTAATKLLQDSIKALADTLRWGRDEARDLISLYNSGPANAISGLANGDAVCKAAKLTKQQVADAIYFASEFADLFANAAVDQGAHMTNLLGLTNGNAALANEISAALEALGTRLVTLAATLIAAHREARRLVTYYNATEIAAAVAAISASTVVFGADATKTELTAGVTLAEQFRKMLDNEAVTTGDYAATLAMWQRF